MAQANEFPCGCIVHPIAGRIRNCPGLPSRSLSGRLKPQDEGSKRSHDSAMNASPDKVKTYEVANILP